MAPFARRILLAARGQDAQFALRHRYADLAGMEYAPDRTVYVRAHVVDAVHGIGDPKSHFEPHAVVFEGHQARYRRRFAQDAWMVADRFEQCLQRAFRIIVVADHHRQPQPHAFVGVAPVDHGVGDEVLVGDQGLDPVAVAHDDVAAPQLLYPAEILGAGAGVSGEADDITGLDRLGRSAAQTHSRSCRQWSVGQSQDRCRCHR